VTNDEIQHEAAGVGFAELAQDELREDRTASLGSSGYFCSFTLECNC
jgi:hypothetical protein